MRWGGAIKRWAKEGAIYEARALRGLEGLDLRAGAGLAWAGRSCQLLWGRMEGEGLEADAKSMEEGQDGAELPCDALGFSAR